MGITKSQSPVFLWEDTSFYATWWGISAPTSLVVGTIHGAIIPSMLKLLVLFAIIEVVGIIVGATGVAVEIAYGADLGVIMITAGSVSFGVGSGLWAKVYVGGSRG